MAASWCRRWGIAEQDMADVLQDIFSAVAAHLARFRKERPTDTFRGWLSTIARNKVRDHFRRRAMQPTAAGGTAATQQLQQIPDPDSLPEPEDVTDHALIDDLLRKALEAIRSEFHTRTWQAFWGVVVEGRPTLDVATDLAMTPGAVRVAKSRVLLRLRRELGDIPDP
jgi:RNA polymerase sigma-70 factor (ECF subfamily)